MLWGFDCAILYKHVNQTFTHFPLKSFYGHILCSFSDGMTLNGSSVFYNRNGDLELTLGKKKKTLKAAVLAKLKPVSDQELWSLTVPQLRQLAQRKQILNRSKLKRKEDFVKALLHVVIMDDLQKFGLEINREIKVDAPSLGIPPSLSKRVLPEGERIDGAVLGIDVHEECLTYCIIDAKNILKEGEYPNTREGIAELIKLCLQLSVQGAAMESTADYWRKVYWALVNALIPALVANANQTKNTQGQKTDPKDAFRIALAHRDGRLKPSNCCSKQVFVIKKTFRAALKMNEKGTAFANQLRAYESMADAPKWVKLLSKSAYGRTLLTDLDTYSDVEPVKSALVAAHPSWTTEVVEKKAQQVWDFYRNLKQDGLWALYLDRLACLLFHRDRAAQLFSTALRDAVHLSGYLEQLQLLLTTSCIGIESGAMILAEIVDITRFPTPESLVRWIGLNPSVNQSGRYKNKTGPITKKGNKYLRKLFYMCAQNDYVHGNTPGHPLGKWLRDRKERLKVPYKKAIVAGARKLVTWVWAMLTHNEGFKFKGTEDMGEKFKASVDRKIHGLQKQLERVAQISDNVLQGTIQTIKAYESFNPIKLYSQQLKDVLQNCPDSIQRVITPMISVGLSNSFWELDQT